MSEKIKINSVAEMIQEAECAPVNVTDSSEQGTARWVYALFTDHLFLKKWDQEENLAETVLKCEDRLLELRLFWENAEYKATRSSISGSFRFRVKNNDISADCFDEKQFLDGNMGTLRVRNYVSYYQDSGQAYVSDWRMVKLEAGENGKE